MGLNIYKKNFYSERLLIQYVTLCSDLTSFYFIPGLLIAHAGVWAYSSRERLPKQHSKTPHVTLMGVAP